MEQLLFLKDKVDPPPTPPYQRHPSNTSNPSNKRPQPP